MEIAPAAAMAVALFVVTDLEYPRLGFVRVDSFDHFTKALYDRCNGGTRE